MKSYLSHPAMQFNRAHSIGTRVVVRAAGTLLIAKTSGPAYPRGHFAFVRLEDMDTAVNLDYVTALDTPAEVAHA